MNIVSNITVSNIAVRWDAWSQTPNVLRLSSTLLHFVWQGALAAAVALLLLAILKRRSPQARYVSLLALFALMTAAPLITWFSLRLEERSITSIEFVVAPDAAKLVPVRETDAHATALAFPGATRGESAVGASAAPSSFDATQNKLAVTGPIPSRCDAILSAVAEWLKLYRPWMATAWLLGVWLLGLRLVIGLAGAELTRRRGRVAAPQAVERAVAQLAGCLGIRRPVAVFESALTVVPTLVGWLSPVILLPASAISGLTAEQLKAILAHELAHVRRHDYLVNLLQIVVETLLFYHPAVWWLSRKIRQERELCCDDVAVELCGDRIAYARALATLEERRASQPSWVTAASGGVLANRIRRLVGRPQPAGADRLSLVTVLAAMLLVVCVVARTAGPLDAASQAPANLSGQQAPSTSVRSSGSTSTPTVAGRLEDEKGAPIAGAHLFWVIWKTSDNTLPTPAYVEAQSDAEGRFRIQTPDSLKGETGLRAGDLWVLAPAKDLVVIESREGLVTDGKSREWVVRLKPAKDLTLVVVDPEGQPLRNAIVEPTNYRNPRGGDFGFPETLRKRLLRTSDADGKVVMPGLASDRLQGVVTSSSQFGTQRFWLRPIGASSQQSLNLDRVGRIKGQVTAPKGESVRGLVFTLRTIGPTTGQITGVATVTTDESGRFEVPAIAQGTLMIDLKRDPRDAKPTLLPELPDRARVKPNETATINIPLAATVLVRGLIETDDTHTPVPGALIAVVYGPTFSAVHVTSDEKGRFEARVLPGPVSNAVLTIPPAFQDSYQDSRQSPGNREVEVAAGATAELPPIRLAPLKKFHGKVIDRSGRPLAGVELCADSKNRRYGFCKTNEKGEFSTTIPRTIAIDGYEIWVEVHSRERICKFIVEQKEPLVLRVTNWPEQHDPPKGGSDARPAKKTESNTAAGPVCDFHIVTTRGKPVAGAIVRPWAHAADRNPPRRHQRILLFPHLPTDRPMGNAIDVFDQASTTSPFAAENRRFEASFLILFVRPRRRRRTTRVAFKFPETQEIDVRNLIWAGMFVASGFVPAATFAADRSLVNPSASTGSLPAIGARIEGISVRDVHGKPWSLAEVGREKIVVLAFMGTECPLVKAYVPRLVEMARKYESKGVVFLGIDPNRQDSHTELSSFVRTNQIPFAVAKDLKQRIADAVGATRTPEVVVLDRERRLRYRGRIDDQFGFIPTNKAAAYHRPKPAQNDLVAALDAILAGQPVAHAETTASGCLIGRDRPVNPQGRVTYSNQISRLLNQRCVVCHRAGQIAPFALTSYEEAAGWADMMDEVAQSGRMPPWGADARVGKFRNEGHLTDAERQILSQWAADGAPRGNPQDLPEAPKFAEGWMIPKPDEILYMQDKPFDVPATGVVDYQFLLVDPGWKEDRWISAIEARPGNPAVVHHILILVLPPGGTVQGLGGDDDFLAAYAPGARPERLPAGMARRVKAGSKLIFQMHYTPNGTRQTDRSSVGIKFADPKSVQKEVVVSSAINAVFQIPAGAADQEVHSRYIFKRDSLLLSLMPHMHLRGKDFMYEAVYPDGRHETLLSVPRYDFGWQTTYRLDEPKPMPQGTVLQCVAHYDNSADNLNNPNPSVTVGWGDQTFDEMMIGFFEAAPADENLTKAHWPKRLTRLEQFDVILRATKGEPDENVKVAAYLALKDQEWMTRFGFILTLMVPQVDRVCVTSIENGQVKQINGPFPPSSKKPGQPVPEELRSPLPQSAAETEPLAKDIAGTEPIVHQDLTRVPGPIFAAMVRRGARSSLHVPVTIRGKKVIVNYWSRDLAAFPAPAVQILTGLTKVMASAQADQKNVTQQ